MRMQIKTIISSITIGFILVWLLQNCQGVDITKSVNFGSGLFDPCLEGKKKLEHISAYYFSPPPQQSRTEILTGVVRIEFYNNSPARTLSMQTIAIRYKSRFGYGASTTVMVDGNIIIKPNSQITRQYNIPFGAVVDLAYPLEESLSYCRE